MSNKLSFTSGLEMIDRVGGYEGKKLSSIEALLGDYSRRESLDANAGYIYIWDKPSHTVRLTFNNQDICIKAIEERKSRFAWIKELRKPALLAIFAGLISIGVGYTWEYFKFKRQTVFEKRIDLILESRKQVQDIYIEYDRLIRQTRAYEKEYKRLNLCDQQNLSGQVEEIKLLGLRVKYIKEFSKGVISNSELQNNIDSFENENLKYINCLNSNTDCRICTDEFPLTLSYLNKIIELHTMEINSQIK